MRNSEKLEYKGIHGSLSIEFPARGVALLRYLGRDVGEFGDVPLRELEKYLVHDTFIELFIDAREVQGVSLEVSSHWAQWLSAHRSHFKHISIIPGSRFVQLTADFVRRFATLGDVMRIYLNPAAFDEALTNAITE